MSNRLVLAVLTVAALTGPALAEPARQAILDQFARQAKQQNGTFAGFSAERGQAFFTAKHTGGKPDTSSCTDCHSSDPRNPGQTKAGKAIDPLAVSKAPKRFTDPAEVEKWFHRNCNAVLGRECSPQERGDVITYLSGL